MRSLRNLSIKRKLTIIVMAASSVALLIACAALVFTTRSPSSSR